ncbi:hypothetical protein GGE07_006516 [Sinorhizobium terangae]|uniref:Uncharacterized protein n=1 Tax=Sinorhizobium terangae TaxID=110322 RepID=A0A6N7LH46_SINTE|nr:hypothetical protein [Sinorhizobium terangae]MBB4189812.1 hypothetical protein [Sinorhizobium terangae]MQX16518.1 hypothetical protein [Sinorhizobium terangae]
MAVAAEFAIETRLRMAGLRPTRQRVALADLEVLDIPISSLVIDNSPEPPEGMEIAHVDVVIRLRPIQR